LLSACQVQKSANPLSPTVAGPVEGVVISTPNLLEPGQDWTMRSRDQPLMLLFQNADTSGVRQLKYSFDIASDAEFKNIVFARTGVEPGSDGVTRFQLPDKLAAGTYWWRTRAEDGANTGSYSTVKSFQVLADVILSPPIPSSPSNGETIDGLIPQFKVKAGNRSGVTADLEYILQVSNNSSFSSIAAIFTKDETWPETTFAPGYSFLYGKTYYWRVRAWHTDEGAEQSNWSSVFSFKTPEPPVSAPPPDSGSGPDPDPNPSPSNPSSCNSSKGSDIADCIEARYPQYLVANVSLSRRQANMAFLRDRMIEHGKCRGLDLGLNLKRGGPSISYDFLVWRRSGQPDTGVDIASGYDALGNRLSLGWLTYGADRNYGHPYYKNYGPVSCN
jgi:hypothetical protein